MTSHRESANPRGPEGDQVPRMQALYDNLWFLFAISLAVILISYLAWGFIDLIRVPPAP